MVACGILWYPAVIRLTDSIGNSLITIAIVSIVFRHRDFHFKIVWLDTKRKLNGNRMYMLLHPNHFTKIGELQQYAEIILLFPYENRYPYTQKSPTVFLIFSFKQA